MVNFFTGMVMKKLGVIFACVVLLVTGSTVFASQGDFAFGLKAGTLGGGVEITSGVFEDVYFRGGANYLSLAIDATSDQVVYDMDADFTNGSLILDWHPFSGIFRVSIGMFINGNEITAVGTPRLENLPAEYQRFAPVAESMKVRGKITFNDVSPYAGFGWNSNSSKEKGWGVAFDVGVFYQGAPNVSTLTANVPPALLEEAEDASNAEAVAAATGLLNDFLIGEQVYLESELEDYEFYPVVSLTLSYNF